MEHHSNKMYEDKELIHAGIEEGHKVTALGSHTKYPLIKKIDEIGRDIMKRNRYLRRIPVFISRLLNKFRNFTHRTSEMF